MLVPSILFTKVGTGSGYSKNYYVHLLPCLLTRLETDISSIETGKILSPVINLENVLNAYYNKGLSEGNHHYLHYFAIKFNRALEKGMQIITGVKDNGARFFLISNPYCEHPKFYYS